MNAVLEAGSEICLGSAERVPLGEGRAYLVEGRKVAVFRQRDGSLYATDALCPHENGPLAEGIVGGCAVICPLHSRKFDLATGECLNDPEISVRTYPIRLSEGRIYLTLA
jgi:nitrite reductase (NADH) small subunit